MKKLLVIVAVLSLNGCALYDAYMMTGYDTNEYRIITEIRTDAGEYKTQCTDAGQSRINAEAITRKTALFENYSQEIPRNSNGINASKNLNESVFATPFNAGFKSFLGRAGFEAELCRCFVVLKPVEQRRGPCIF
jgi:hypothetical protein